MTKPKKTTDRKPNASLKKPVQPDGALAVIVGSTPVPRGELTKSGLYQEEQAAGREEEDSQRR
jgi:hypothetical protein